MRRVAEIIRPVAAAAERVVTPYENRHRFQRLRGCTGRHLRRDRGGHRRFSVDQNDRFQSCANGRDFQASAEFAVDRAFDGETEYSGCAAATADDDSWRATQLLLSEEIDLRSNGSQTGNLAWCEKEGSRSGLHPKHLCGTDGDSLRAEETQDAYPQVSRDQRKGQ